MTSADVTPFPNRIAALRADLRDAGWDGLLITHLPNIRYVTGFTGTAGAVILTANRCTLVVDFRYATSAREVIATHLDGTADMVLVDRTYDDTLIELLKQHGAQQIGIEGASMTVSRFRRLSAALEPADSAAGAMVLVPTDRVVERRRAVKDEFEIETLRVAADRLSQVARQVPALVREGRSELEVAADIDTTIRAAGFERPAFETIVASGPNSARPHGRPGYRRLVAGDGVVLDFGGVYDGYCVDLTRTLHLGPPVVGTATPRGGCAGGPRRGSCRRQAGSAAQRDRPGGPGRAGSPRPGRSIRPRNRPRIGSRGARRSADSRSFLGPYPTIRSGPGWSSQSSRAPTWKGSAEYG